VNRDGAGEERKKKDSAALLGMLLGLQPRRFRERYGEEMTAFQRERIREARSRGSVAAIRAWLRVLADVVATAATEHRDAIARREPRADGREHTTERGPRAMMSSTIHDLRYAARGLLRRPAFTAVVVLTLALGVGANAAIFSVVNAVLLKPLPFARPEQLVEVRQEAPYYSVSEPEFMDYRRGVRAFRHLAAWAGANATITGADDPERVDAVRVTDQFFEALGVVPARGRPFSAEENAPAKGPSPVVIISDALWRHRFAADPGVVGRTMIVNDVPRTVIGVMPPHLGYPAPSVALWLPLRLDPDKLWTRNNHYLTVVGRVAPGATVEQAAGQASALARRWPGEFPDIYTADQPLRVSVQPMRDVMLGTTRPYLIALLGAVGFVLLIACVNVANLLLARGESRRKELAIRTALGASGARLARQAITESLLLAGLGGALGLAVAWAGTRALVSLAPDSVPRLDEVRIDMPVLLFTALVAVATGLLFGLAPAMRAARGQSADTLKQGGKTSSTVGGTHRTRRVLVVAEVALAVVMLGGAGLMLRSLARLNATDMGFDASHLLTMRLALPAKAYDGPKRARYFEELTSRVAAIPGVRGAAAVRMLPMSQTGDDGWSIALDGYVPKTIAESKTATPSQVTPNYFRVMRIPVLRGRAFTDADREGAPLVAVVNETMAKQFWPKGDAVGHTLKMYSEQAPWVTIVGVVKDIRSTGLLSEVLPMMYFPHAQSEKSAYGAPGMMSLVVRTEGDPMEVARAAQGMARSLDRNVPISQVMTMEQVVASSIASRRFSTTLLGAFAALALALAGVGIYGVIAFAVSQRTFELGVRMALGASRGAVMRLVVSEALGMAVVGLCVGLAGALAVGYLGRSLLVGVGAVDVPTLALVSLTLAAVALLASAMPARRATLVNPTEALRDG
jgi:putative ABC transport system permease protein